MNGMPSLLEKCTGALVASAIGDALGWPYELRARNSSRPVLGDGVSFTDWKRRAGGKYWKHDETIYAGEYSDDTQMILAVSRSMISEDWKKTFSAKELPFWLDYERGGGTALKRAARAYRNKMYPWENSLAADYFNAGGNGAVMRILPHVVTYAYSQNIDQLMRDVIMDSTMTHGHPRAVLGAACYAFSLYMLMKKGSVLQFGELIDTVIMGSSVWGKYRVDAFPPEWAKLPPNILSYDYAAAWNDQVNEMTRTLHMIQDSLRKGLLVNDKEVLTSLKCFDKEGGAGDVAILASLYLASKYANNPVLGIKTAAHMVGTDTDTIASITGGLLGMLCGTIWIPLSWQSVQDYDYICNTAGLLLSDDKAAARKGMAAAGTDRPDLQDTPIGKVYRLDEKVLPCGKDGQVVISRWKTLYGQTVYFKTFQRIDQVKQTTTQASTRSRTLTLDYESIQKLLKDSVFSRVSLKKVLQVADKLICGGNTISEIANSLRVNVEIVDVISQHIK